MLQAPGPSSRCCGEVKECWAHWGPERWHINKCLCNKRKGGSGQAASNKQQAAKKDLTGYWVLWYDPI